MLAPFSPTDLSSINQELALLFGTEIDGRPKYRVAWANDEFEHRKGIFEIFFGHIFIRTEYGVKRVKKYPWAENRYILERLLYYQSDEIVDAINGAYESIWLFVDKDNNYLPPHLEVCKRIIRTLEAPKQKKTESDAWDEEMKDRRKRIQADVELMAETGPSTLFYPGPTGKQGVFIDSQKVKK